MSTKDGNKSFPIETDDYFYQVVRYVERNPLRANLVERAEEWRWSSLGCRTHGTEEERAILGDWPLSRPRQWRHLVNQPQTDAELQALRRCVQRNQPYGIRQRPLGQPGRQRAGPRINASLTRSSEETVIVRPNDRETRNNAQNNAPVTNGTVAAKVFLGRGLRSRRTPLGGGYFQSCGPVQRR